MRGYRFYLDYYTPRKRRRGQHKHHVIATRVKSDGRSRLEHITKELTYYPSREATQGITWTEIVAVQAETDKVNAPIKNTTVPRSYLDGCCKLISEAKAREHHPKLFEYLDALPAITRKPQQR